MEFQIYAIKDISIHALREEGDFSFCRFSARLLYFYPRPPRGGRLGAHSANACAICDFYPRPPRGGRLFSVFLGVNPIKISIHALREEGDSSSTVWTTPASYFYPRPPRGGRPDDVLVEFRDGSKFLSTPSARRATTRGRHRRGRPDPFLSTPSARRAT